ncbi:ankyrin repeat-containing domain protein [Lactarius sanguifluus]|nr:ankyrin repeat-containing domain protein [Lactarius sanguifluus]
MSSSLQPEASSSSPNFQPIFEKALQEYKRKTGKDLTTHPFAAEIKACDSPEAILTVLEGKANELNQSRSSDERLAKWLNPTVNILNALSGTLGEGVGSVFPPTKIIFSGIGILLVAAKDTVANRDVLVELFGGIESFFERLRIYTEVPPPLAVTNLLVKNMVDILQILAIATKGIKEKRPATFLKKLVGMNDDIKDALQRLRKLEQGELLTVIAQTLRETSGLQDDTKATKTMIKEVTDKMDARDWKEMLLDLKGWLSPSDPSTNYAIGLRDLHKETATWFLEGRIFQEWYSMGSLLWIHGKPGSGKSILCSAIIQRLVSLCDDGRASVAYFYFDFRDDNKKHLHDLLPSLLFQFAAHSVPCCDIISCIYSTHGKGTQKPSDEVLIDCLMNVLSAKTQDPVYIVVDALDECPNTSGVRPPRERVLSLIKDLINLRLPNVHICVTSRPEIDIRIRLEPLTSLRVSLHDQTGHKEDIANYINSEVDVVASDKKWREDDKELVIETLSEKADGMFRWVYCQLEMLRLCFPSRVRRFVNELPDSLDETYERVLKGIPRMNQGHVHRLLQCLTVAVRPLRVVELAAILTFDVRRLEDQEQEVLSACPSLITIVDSDGWRVVQFSHFSVKEFLTSDRLATSKEDISHYYILPDAAHTCLARVSLDVLLRLDDRVDRSNANNIPLAKYAAEHWVSHAQVGNVSSSVLDEMKTLFDSDKPHFEAWLRIYDIDKTRYEQPQSRSDTVTPLYYSALCGFYGLVQHLVKKHPQHVNAIGGGTCDYPLAAALYNGHILVAELLFRHGANIGAQGTEGRTPLHTVARSRNNLAVDAVRFLLGRDADVNAQQTDLSTPLHDASSVGNLEVARVLLDNGADVNAKTGWGWTPLHQVTEAYGYPSSDVARLLIERGADVNAQDKYHDTPLHLMFYDRLELARILLDCGANVNAKNKQGHTPLYEHLSRSYEGPPSFEEDWPLARLYAERGADLNEYYNGEQTLLHRASECRALEWMQSLLDVGANVNAVDTYGRTPLHLVHDPAEDFFDEDSFAPTQLLVVRGADVNQPDDAGSMPLHQVLQRSWEIDLELVRMLVDAGAKVNVKDHQGWTPLHTMFYSGCDHEGIFCAVLQLLMGRGADVNAQDNDHETPLHIASRYWRLEKWLEIVWILLGHGADLSMENKEGKTPFQLVREKLMREMKQPQSKYFAMQAWRVRSVVTMSLLYGY